MEQFSRMDRQLPQLKNIVLNNLDPGFGHFDQVFDLSPFFIFLSSKPIERFILRLSLEDWLPFSDVAVKAWAKMDSLLWMQIDTTSTTAVRKQLYRKMFASDDIRCLIPPGSWPRLTELSIDGTWPLTELGTILCACPALVTLKYILEAPMPFCLLSTLTLIDQHCPLIESVVFHGYAPIKRISPTDVVYLSRINLQFAHLCSLNFGWQEIDHKTLRLLISKIKHIPLTEAAIPVPDKDSYRGSELSAFLVLAMFRHFPLLQMIGIQLFSEEGTAELVRSVTRTLPDGRCFPFTSNSVYPMFYFDDGVDEEGRTGRQAFFDFICNALSVDEKASLAA